jgi:hypothetical protein
MVSSIFFGHLYRCQHHLFHFKCCGKIMGQIMKPIEHQQIYKERAYRVEPMQGLIKEISILVGGKAVDGIRPADHVIARLPVPFGWVAVPAGDSP